MLTRLETMCLMAGIDLPLLAIREQMARAMNMVVFRWNVSPMASAASPM